jgi:hypothetical protein
MMAYPTISAPYGLKPINLIGGQVFAGATRQLPITTSGVNYATAIFYGDVVQLASSGTVIISTLDTDASPVAGVVGVFLGCSYTNPTTKQKQYSQYWPGAASGITDAMAYIADDPDQLYKVASVGDTADGTGLVIAPVQQTAVGTNAVLVLNTGSTTSGDSKIGIYSAGTTTSLPMRIVDVVPDTSYVSSGNIVFPEVIVKLNFGYHSYYNAVGV